VSTLKTSSPRTQPRQKQSCEKLLSSSTVMKHAIFMSCLILYMGLRAYSRDRFQLDKRPGSIGIVACVIFSIVIHVRVRVLTLNISVFFLFSLWSLCLAREPSLLDFVSVLQYTANVLTAIATENSVATAMSTTAHRKIPYCNCARSTPACSPRS
jgi:hypothetical protein